MDILILGGPKFLGRATIDAALAAGHNVTVLNRGQTNPDLYPQIEKLRGDRDGNLDALKGRKWDVVIDNSGYVPRIVRQSAELLADSVRRYVFVSSVSVYKDFAQPGVDEDYPVATLADETVEEVTGETYGGLKALSERVVQDVYGDRALLIRPGLIVGPHDPTHRFTYWVTRAARGGDILAPVSPDYPVHVIDVRDLAEWTIRMAEAGASGVYNVTGPEYNLTLGAIIETAAAVTGADARPVYASEEFLLANNVTPWSDMPLWAPADNHVHRLNFDRALSTTLTFRPLEVTVRDTLAWSRTEPPPDPPPAGLTPEREKELLATLTAMPPSPAPMPERSQTFNLDPKNPNNDFLRFVLRLAAIPIAGAAALTYREDIIDKPTLIGLLIATVIEAIIVPVALSNLPGQVTIDSLGLSVSGPRTTLSVPWRDVESIDIRNGAARANRLYKLIGVNTNRDYVRIAVRPKSGTRRKSPSVKHLSLYLADPEQFVRDATDLRSQATQATG